MRTLLTSKFILGVAGALFLSAPANATHPVDVSDQHKVDAGKAIFQENCVACHGQNLRGPEDPSAFEGIKPPRLDGHAGHASHHSDLFLFERIKNGSLTKSGELKEGGMPPFDETLTDQEIWNAISYVKSKWPARVRAKQEKMNPGHGHKMPENKGGHGHHSHGHGHK